MNKRLYLFVILIALCICTLSGCGAVKDVTVACWGDSLTEGVAGDGVTYPDELARLTGYKVENFGVASEGLITIAARSGAIKIVLDEALEILPNKKPVDISFSGRELYDQEDYAGRVVPANTKRGGWTPATIHIDDSTKVEGKLYTSFLIDEKGVRYLTSATFLRNESGEAIDVPKGAEITVAAHDMDADINIYWAGTNYGWDDTDEGGAAIKPENIILALKKMILENAGIEFRDKRDVIDAKIPEEEKFIVIGLTTGGASSWPGINEALSKEFGEKFFDAKAYLATEQALKDAGIEATEQDIEYIKEGKVPFSLLGGYRFMENPGKADEVHLNGAGYKLVAKQVYKKMKKLGY